jgi:hypothetical protein
VKCITLLSSLYTEHFCHIDLTRTVACLLCNFPNKSLHCSGSSCLTLRSDMESQKQEYVQLLWKTVTSVRKLCICVHYHQTHFCGLLHELCYFMEMKFCISNQVSTKVYTLWVNMDWVACIVHKKCTVSRGVFNTWSPTVEYIFPFNLHRARMIQGSNSGRGKTFFTSL